jgi:hypothetical protein
MGKSSLLTAIVAHVGTGSSVLVLDPLGETARAVRDDLRERGVGSILSIGPSEVRIAVNALEGIAVDQDDPVRSERRLNDLVHAFRRVRAGRYADPFWGPRLEEILTRALRAAALLPSGTIEDAHTLLSTGARAPRAEGTHAQEAVRELAQRIRDRPDDAEGARRLLYEVVRSPVLARLVCAREPTRSPGDLVRPGRVVLVSGEAAEVGESTARYFLAIYLALAWSELLARRERGKVYVVLDEAQWFGHESLAEMLRLGRRANVHVVLATQALAALPEAVREAAWTNVADFVLFRGSPEEAREVGRMVPSISPEAMFALPRGHALFLEGKGHRVEWIRTARRPIPGVPEAPEATNDPTAEASAASEEGVFRWLRAAAARDGDAAEVTVGIDVLRRVVDPAGAALRRAGARLGRSGALRTERTTHGTRWRVRVGGIPPPPAPDTPEEAARTSAVPQRS